MKKIYGWNIALILLSFVTVGFFLTIAPDSIPAHYDLAGNIDRWGSKYEYLLFPVSTAAMGLFLLLIGRFEGKQGRNTNETVVGYLCFWVLVLFNTMWVFFMWKAMDGTGLSGGESLLLEKGVMVLLMASLIPLGNIMPRATKNSLFGLRTKWSMADDICWQKSQRFGAYLLMGTGIAGVAISSILPEFWGSCAVLGLLGIMIVGSYVGSYRIWKKEQEKKK